MWSEGGVRGGVRGGVWSDGGWSVVKWSVLL